MDKSLAPKSSFLQTDLWASFRESLGWYAHRVDDILVLERPLPAKNSLLYSPEVYANPEVLLTLLPKVYDIAGRRSSMFYRLELLVDKQDPLAESWLAALTYTGFTKSFESVQPDDRQIIPLSENEETVLGQMKQKGRYNIRLAEKAGVMVRESTPKTLRGDVQIFYNLFQQTAKRDKFTIRPQSYFDSLCDMLYQHKVGRLFIATYENTPVGAAIITLYDGTASYLYGASGNDYRNKMGPYAMHWAIMQWAISQNAQCYDLLAIRPEGQQKHAYDGITRFKEQFGGQSVHLLGSWDLAFKKDWYKLFSIVEKMRRK